MSLSDRLRPDVECAQWIIDEVISLEHALTQVTMKDLWLPMESAPKDGTDILLYRPDAYAWGRVSPGKWCQDQYARKKPRPYWASWHKLISTTEARTWTPTMWRPLVGPHGY